LLARLRRTPKRRLGIAFAVATVALAGGWALLAGSHRDPAGSASAEARPDKPDLPPLPWQSEPAAVAAKPPEPQPAAAARPKERNGVAIGGPEAMPPASAGSNGSYTPRPAAERERIEALTHPAGGPAERAALLVGDTAIAPFGAPPEIQAAISAANQITNQPYRWGGGHSSWRSAGYDCSGAVSYALGGAGLLGAPATSGELATWGAPGRGRWLTIYANGSHVYAVIAGLRWDTVGNASGSGPRWHPADAYPIGYAARHIPGL
jgi:cell wall-associated NlpC family hydrolase